MLVKMNNNRYVQFIQIYNKILKSVRKTNKNQDELLMKDSSLATLLTISQQE